MIWIACFHKAVWESVGSHHLCILRVIIGRGHVECFKISVRYFAHTTGCMILTFCSIMVVVTLQYITLHVVVMLNIVVALRVLGHDHDIVCYHLQLHSI